MFENQILRPRAPSGLGNRVDGQDWSAANGAIELRRGCGKCLSHLQKALRHDLRTGENEGMVGLG